MNQSTGYIRTLHNRTLWPALPNNVKSETLLQKQKRKSYYDQTAKPLPPIEKEEIIARNPV